MAPGPKEAARRAMREAKAAGVSKRRTAPPSKQVIPVQEVLTHNRVDQALKKAELAEGSQRGRPKGPYEVAVTLKLASEMAAQIDAESMRRRLTRSEAIRVLLEKALT